MHGVELIDSSLREGQQSPEIHASRKYILNPWDKSEIAASLLRYGHSYVEVFSGVVSGENPSAKDDIQILREVRMQLEGQLPQPTYILAHCRCRKEDVATAIESGVDGLNLFIRTSDPSRGIGRGATLEGIIRQAYPLISEIRRNYPNLLLRFSGEDAFRTSMEDLYAVYDPIAELVDRFGFPDTVGVATPEIVRDRVIQLRERYPKVDLEGHFHNDRGLSLINAVTAIKAGLRYINTSVLGLGERSGITSTTALLFNLYLENPDLVKNYDISSSYALNVLVAQIFRIMVPHTEPVSLTNRTHNAGVHANHVMQDRTRYEAHPLQKFGVTDTKLLLGPLSGWHIIHYCLDTVLQYVGVDEYTAKQITRRFKQQADGLSDKCSPMQLLINIAEEMGLRKNSSGGAPEPAVFLHDS